MTAPPFGGEGPEAPPPPSIGPPVEDDPRRARSSTWGDRVKRTVASAIVLGALVGAAAMLAGDGGGHEHWTFLDKASLAELGLVAHGARSGSWLLEDVEAATGGRALANHEGEPGASPALVVAMQPRSRDIRAQTRCMVVGTAMKAEAFADVPAACGVVFRFVDEQNHWIVRAIAGESAIEAATVVRGNERVLRRAPAPHAVEVGRWIELSVEVRGDVVKASLDGQPVLVAESTMLPAAAGSVGLWAPAGATAYFDHFTIETLTASPRALEILPILGKRG